MASGTQDAAHTGTGIVVFFSVHGSTARAARTVAEQTGAALAEIRPVDGYDADRRHYEGLLARAKKEHAQQARPELAERIDLTGHDTIFLGYPLWDAYLPMPVVSFLENHDLTGRTIAPFNTHMGGGDAGTHAVIADLVPGARVVEGLAIQSDAAAAGAAGEIAAWLDRLDLT